MVKTLWKKTNPHQLFHFADCADEQSLVESQGGVDCSSIQL